MKTSGEHGYKFAVCRYSFVVGENQIVHRQFIVLKDPDDIIISFTDFHRYIHSSRKRGAKHISDDGNNRFIFIVAFLNYIIFEHYEKYQIHSILKISKKALEDYFTDYGLEHQRTKGTVDRCVSSIIDFLCEVISENSGKCTLKISDFTTKEIYRTKRGNTQTRLVPSFNVFYSKRKKQIFRDMPNSVFSIFMSYAAEYFQDIYFLMVLSAFAGLRPSESCSVSQYTLLLTQVMGKLSSATIDLMKERPMRSDLANVGSIKKERMQKVYPKFIEAFDYSYYLHMDYLKNKKFEEDYAPLSINRNGMAYTYQAYYQRFQKLVKKIRPILLASEDREVVEYGMMLMETRISPHIFRHWFSVRLTLYGESIAGLQYWRGDKSPESALLYLQNKGELEKQLRQVSNGIFEFALYQSSIQKGMNGGRK